MKIDDLRRTKIEVTVPAGHKGWLPLSDDAIKVDGQVFNSTLTVSVEHTTNGLPTITICDQRVLYPTDLYFNGVLRATDNGLLWDKRPILTATPKEGSFDAV